MSYKFLILTLGLIGLFSRVSAQEKPQTFTAQGISIEFTATPARPGATQVVAGEEMSIRFKITGANGDVPLSNLRPVAWIDQRQTKEPMDARVCREKVQAFLQPSFSSRPTADLNTFFILALNNEPNISVIDPLSGFGGSKLYTLIPLKSPGEDWVLTAGNKRLYVSMPQVNQVAVIDIPTWKVIANIDAGTTPTRVGLQHDERYLWVGNDSDGASGVTVIDTATNKVAAQIKTGLGHHEIAFNDDDRLAFVTNKAAGTLSLIDIRKLTLLKDLQVGSQPTAIAFSSLSQTAYVANEGDGTISAISAAKHDVAARIQTEPGVRVIRIPAAGHYGFAVNSRTNTVYAFDLSSNRVVQRVPVGPGSDQLSFTKQFAYVRSSGSEFVTMINMANIGKEANVTKFPAGQRAPGESPSRSHAAAIVPAPEEGAVLVANPADKMIYYYTEGMAAPMGSFQNYKRDPRALLVMDNSLRETARGVYTTTARLNNPGQYDVAFLLDSPRLINCFELKVAENPNAPKKVESAFKIEPVAKEAVARVGERFTLRFKVIDFNTGAARTGLSDVSVLVFLAPGIWQQRELAKTLDDGVYETSFVPPSAGVYYVFIQSSSLGLQYNQSTPLTIQAAKP
ncbi:MAG TPA: cytochrome D1 domain-containing protein [Pyrinomonadaceae bacterium]|nr:cytochrome D1 domain-containing protein [Pyrinomonadaceae bacterium]